MEKVTPENVPEVKLTEDWLSRAAAGGSNVTETENAIVTDAPGEIVPMIKPVAGLVPGLAVPSTTTEPDTKTDPAGIASVNSTLLTAAIPLFVTTEV